MNEKRRVSLPRYRVGGDAYEGLAGVLRPLGNRVLLAGGERALAAGAGEFIRALSGSGIQVLGPALHAGNTTDSAIDHIVRRAREEGAQLLAGMGGGRALDTVKAAALRTGLPVVTLPTIAATCAAVTALCVVYREDGHFDRFEFLKEAPAYSFIHTGIIARAPADYLRAGMGDSIAKHFETAFAARGSELSYADSLALAVADTCYRPLLKAGVRALSDCDIGEDSPALREAVQCCIVSTGMVSLLISEQYNGALAHSLYYALESLPEVSEGCLHGDVVAYGTLVQLILDGQPGAASDLLGLLRDLGVPLSLKAMGVDTGPQSLARIALDAAVQPDMACLPYPVGAEPIARALAETERLVAETAALAGRKSDA